VELAALADPGLLPQAVASALQVREVPGRPLTETLLEHLRPRSLLLLLDNCEHLLSACARLTEELLQHSPGLRVLATSREALGVPGEITYRVPSLALPDPQQSAQPHALREIEASRLFVERAAAAAPSFALTDQNAAAVAEICRQLDGIPLAIELAAARVKALPVEEIAARLEDRFRLLTGGSRTALPHHQTLRALIDWSYDLLGDPEQVLLRRLSVFAGGWTLEAAEAVCGDRDARRQTGGRPIDPVASPEEASSSPASGDWRLASDEILDLLSSLVDKSLVLYEDRGREPRYRLLETVRQYGWDRLLEAGEAEAVRARHWEYFAELAHRCVQYEERSKNTEWLPRFRTEIDNLRAALGWCRAQADGGGRLLRLAKELWWEWYLCGYWSEGREWLEEALERGSAAPAADRAEALHGVGVLATGQNEYDRALACYAESLALYQEAGTQDWHIPMSLESAALVNLFQGDYSGAAARLEESLTGFQAAGHSGGVGMCLCYLGEIALQQGDPAKALMRCEGGLALFQALGDPWGTSLALENLGKVALVRGEAERATALCEQSLALRREIGHQWGIAWSLHLLGLAALSSDDPDGATARLEESLVLRRQLGDRRGIAAGLEALAECALAGSSPSRSARLLGAAQALREETHYSVEPLDRSSHDRRVSATRALLDEASFTAAWAEGRAMTLEQVMAYAREGSLLLSPHGGKDGRE
jgi:non-specific serine/threonine protein kinase